MLFATTYYSFARCLTVVQYVPMTAFLLRVWIAIQPGLLLVLALRVLAAYRDNLPLISSRNTA
jgi:asparagine N-glycosylation enzyme membrane subunit Stt3